MKNHHFVDIYTSAGLFKYTVAELPDITRSYFVLM